MRCFIIDESEYFDLLSFPRFDGQFFLGARGMTYSHMHHEHRDMTSKIIVWIYSLRSNFLNMLLKGYRYLKPIKPFKLTFYIVWTFDTAVLVPRDYPNLSSYTIWGKNSQNPLNWATIDCFGYFMGPNNFFWVT